MSAGLDLEALSAIDEQIITIGGQNITMTALVPADVEKTRKLVMSKKLEEGYAMEYMTFLAMKKRHPEVTWYKFQKLNFRTVNKLMAVMATMNGFDETFQAFTGLGDKSGTGPGEDPGDELDIE